MNNIIYHNFQILKTRHTSLNLYNMISTEYFPYTIRSYSEANCSNFNSYLHQYFQRKPISFIQFMHLKSAIHIPIKNCISTQNTCTKLHTESKNRNIRIFLIISWKIGSCSMLGETPCRYNVHRPHTHTSSVFGLI